MNNHSNFCQNIIMIIFFIVLIALILILNSKIKLEIQFNSCNLSYNCSVSLFYYKKIKTLYKNDIIRILTGFNGKKNKKDYERFALENFRNFIKFVEFEKFLINIKIGIFDVLPTVLSIPLVSAILAFVYSFIGVPYNKNCNFNVEPAYNRLFLSCKIHCILSVKIVHIIYIIFMLIFGRRDKNEQSSNRGVNEYCYE